MPGNIIDLIHTLGPTGTNCEAAARWWFRQKNREGRIVLHPTLEAAAESLEGGNSALLGCMVYPDLHTLVFSNLDAIVLEDIFVFPTHNMVVASRTGAQPVTVSCHPAPQRLVPDGSKISLVDSNARAAIDCAAGITDGCITTIVCAHANRLKIVKDYGPIPMGFSIHRSISKSHHVQQGRLETTSAEVAPNDA
jgi:hypothetical protein